MTYIIIAVRMGRVLMSPELPPLSFTRLIENGRRNQCLCIHSSIPFHPHASISRNPFDVTTMHLLELIDRSRVAAHESIVSPFWGNWSSFCVPRTAGRAAAVAPIAPAFSWQCYLSSTSSDCAKILFIFRDIISTCCLWRAVFDVL